MTCHFDWLDYNQKTSAATAQQPISFSLVVELLRRLTLLHCSTGIFVATPMKLLQRCVPTMLVSPSSIPHHSRTMVHLHGPIILSSSKRASSVARRESRRAVVPQASSKMHDVEIEQRPPNPQTLLSEEELQEKVDTVREPTLCIMSFFPVVCAYRLTDFSTSYFCSCSCYNGGKGKRACYV
jgi:hypothetical protein